MIEFVPFMLFILGLDPNHPGEIEFQRVEIVYSTLGHCEKAGEAMSKRLTQEAADTTKASYQHRCIPLPKGKEVERAFREFSGEGE